MILDTSSAFDKIVNVMLSRMSPYDGIVSLPNSNLSLVLKKTNSTDLNEKSKLSVMDNDIIIPSLENLSIAESSANLGLLVSAIFNCLLMYFIYKSIYQYTNCLQKEA